MRFRGIVESTRRLRHGYIQMALFEPQARGPGNLISALIPNLVQVRDGVPEPGMVVDLHARRLPAGGVGDCPRELEWCARSLRLRPEAGEETTRSRYGKRTFPVLLAQPAKTGQRVGYRPDSRPGRAAG